MPFDMLVKIASEFYTDDEIVEAKACLYETCATDARNHSRKGPNKRISNVTDMINVIQETEPDFLPVYAACDLGRLPPLDLNSVDISGMSQELKRLKADFSQNNNECNIKRG